MIPSHPNIALIEQFFRAYAANDPVAIRQVLSPGIKWFIPGNHPLSGVKNGIDEVMAFFTLLGKAAFQALPLVVGANDNFVIDCHHNWSNLPEGPNFRGMSCLLWKIEEAKIVEVHNFPEDQHKSDAFFQALYR
jgi:ketosteroid isomerase-like protein